MVHQMIQPSRAALIVSLVGGLMMTGCGGAKQEAPPSAAAIDATAVEVITDPKSGEQASQELARFSDLEDIPGADMIEELTNIGVFEPQGPKDTFRPLEPLTRAEYITWLFKAYNQMRPEKERIRLAPEAEPFFSDTSADHPAYKYIQAMANTGYSIGYGDGIFKPDQPITREEMIAIKVGLDHDAKTLPVDRFDYTQVAQKWGFGDAKDIDKQFVAYVHKDSYDVGERGGNIVRAFGKTSSFKPKEPVLRYQAAATLWQMGWNFKRINAAQVAQSKATAR